MIEEGAEDATYIRGVPHRLPAGERVLWEGAPNAQAMAKHVFHRRIFAAYFAAMIVWWGFTTTSSFGSTEFFIGLSVRLALSAIALAIVEGIARISARTSWYAITNKRVVMKLGMVFPMSINIPFKLVQSAGVAMFKDGTGQILVEVSKEQPLAFAALWPHCGILSLSVPQPILRGLTDAQRIGSLLASAVADAAKDDDASRIESTSVRAVTQGVESARQPVSA